MFLALLTLGLFIDDASLNNESPIRPWRWRSTWARRTRTYIDTAEFVFRRTEILVWHTASATNRATNTGLRL